MPSGAARGRDVGTPAARRASRGATRCRGAGRARLVGQAGGGRRRAVRRAAPSRCRHRRPPAAGPAGAAAVSARLDRASERTAARGRRRRRRLASTRPPGSSTPGRADDERAVEAALRPRRLSEFPGQPRVRDQLGLVLEAAPRRGSAARPRPALGPARARQDDAGDDRRGRARAPIRITSGPAIQHAGDLAAVLSSPRRGGGALPRRDPPDEPGRRGDALPRDGGLPGRRHRRQGPGRHGDPARAAAVHRRRRDDPRRPAARRRCATGSASPATSTTTTPPTS